MIRTLLWKDFRQNRKVLLAVAIFVAVPYLIALASSVHYGHWVGIFAAASIWALVLSIGLTAFIAANAIAGERADRSAEFAAYLPVARGCAVASKAILALVVCAVFFLFNAAVFYAMAPWGGEQFVPGDSRLIITFIGPAVSMLLFGVAWLFSSFSNSPPLAAVAGIASAVLLGAAIQIIDDAVRHQHVLWDFWYPVMCLVIGIPAFLAGAIYYLRRVEP